MYKIKFVLCLFALFVSSGCAPDLPSPRETYSTRTDSRSWKAVYREILTVTTEPPGAKIYIEGATKNYVGTSPTVATLNAGKFRVTQTGTYQELVSYGWYSQTPDRQRVSDTDWNGALKFDGFVSSGGWTIRAVLDGYKISKTELEDGYTEPFIEAFEELKVTEEGKLSPDTITGENSILIVLEPLP